MILDNLISIYSPTPVLIEMAERIIKRDHSEIRWPDKSSGLGLRDQNSVTYIPIKDFKKAREFVTQGGHLLWLEARVHAEACELSKEAITVSGVNSFIACEFAVAVGLRHILKSHQQYDNLTVYILPQKPKLLKFFV